MDIHSQAAYLSSFCGQQKYGVGPMMKRGIIALPSCRFSHRRRLAQDVFSRSTIKPIGRHRACGSFSLVW